MAHRTLRRGPDQQGGHRTELRERHAGETAEDEWLYGRNAVRESLRAGRRRFKRLLLLRGASGGQALGEIVQRTQGLGLRVGEAGREELDGLTSGANHQGVCLLSDGYPYEHLADIVARSTERFYLALDSLQDPQNLGTLLRTAEAVAVGGVLIPEHRSASITPAVVNASAGAVEHLKVAKVGNLARSLDDLKQAGIWVVGLEATPESMPLWDARLDGPIALVVGGEGEGMRRLVRENCDILARLPLLGKVESLNAAAAGSVALYEILRHRR